MKKKYSIYHKNINFLLTPSIKKQPMGRSKPTRSTLTVTQSVLFFSGHTVQGFFHADKLQMEVFCVFIWYRLFASKNSRRLAVYSTLVTE